MKVYNEDKTQILEEYDLSKGYLKSDVLITHIDAIKGIEEQGHYETVAEYPNGGKDVKWIVDVPGVEGKEAYDIKEDIDVYIPYTKKELKIIELQLQLNKYKQLLYDTDYQAIKYAEGYYTEEEYVGIKALRESYREQVRTITEELEKIKEDNT